MVEQYLDGSCLVADDARASVRAAGGEGRGEPGKDRPEVHESFIVGLCDDELVQADGWSRRAARQVRRSRRSGAVGVSMSRRSPTASAMLERPPTAIAAASEPSSSGCADDPSWMSSGRPVTEGAEVSMVALVLVAAAVVVGASVDGSVVGGADVTEGAVAVGAGPAMGVPAAGCSPAGFSSVGAMVGGGSTPELSRVSLTTWPG